MTPQVLAQGLPAPLANLSKEELDLRLKINASPPRWTEFDGAATELEMGDVLYGLVRMTKPVLTFESGCYLGHGTTRIAQALKHNCRGHLVSCDTDAQKVMLVRAALCDQRDGPGSPRDFTGWADVRIGRAIDQPELRECDFFFCDSNYECRAEELEAVKPGCVVVVHDTTEASWKRYGPASRFMGQMVRDLGGVTFEFSRGFGVLVKK